MINVLHLLWIVPVTFVIGAVVMSAIAINKQTDKEG